MSLRPREHIARLDPYEWEAMASDVAAAAGIAESEVVRFDTNTTAWPPVAWEQTVLDAPRLPANEYPHASNEPLRSALATRLGGAATRLCSSSPACTWVPNGLPSLLTRAFPCSESSARRSVRRCAKSLSTR